MSRTARPAISSGPSHERTNRVGAPARPRTAVPVRLRRRITPAVVAAAILLPASAFAQGRDTVLTLSGAQELLRERSPQYRASLASASAAGEGVWSAWGAFFPTASVNASWSRNEFTTETFLDPTGVPQVADPPITSVAKTASQSLNLNWTALNGGRRFFELGASRARAKAADLAAVARLVELETQLATRYFEALKQQELAALAADLLAARRRDLEITRARFRIAAVAQTDVLGAEIQVGQQELAALRAEQAADAARRELSAIIGLEDDISYGLRDTLAVFDPGLLDPAVLVTAARASNPDLARLDEEIRAQRQSVWAARGTWLPNVTLGLSFSRSENLPETGSLLEFSPRNDSESFRLTFSWPLFNGFEKKVRVGQESARLQETRQNRRGRVLEVEKDVRNAYDALAQSYRAVQLQQRNVELARESVRLTTERYRIGAASYIELQNATTQATEAERGLIEARYDFMTNLARLQGAVGRPIETPR